MHKWKFVVVTMAVFLAGALAQATTITIATVSNPDMVLMQKLTPVFEKQYPSIKLDWVILPENTLRQKVTTDIATNAGNYDVITIGNYEVASGWAANGWLVPFKSFPSWYDPSDLLKPIAESLTYKGALYALPFYGESSMTYYRKDLFRAKDLTMPPHPTWTQIAQFAKVLNDPAKSTYGICLRGLPGWGENMGPVDTMINAFGGRWFTPSWQPRLDSLAWKRAITFYVNLVRSDGPPGATSDGFTEDETLFANGHCAMWVDATVAAGYLSNPKTSSVAHQVGFAFAPSEVTSRGSHWLWSWALAIPKSTHKLAAARTFVEWATSKGYIQLAGDKFGWTMAPPGTRYSTYSNPNYLKAAPFASLVLDSINTANYNKSSIKPIPYKGIQFVNIPEFEGLGTQVGQLVAGALAGNLTVDQALQKSQTDALNVMRQAGYTH